MTNPNRKRILLGWYFYDWANSAFVTTVVTAFLGPYLTSLAKTIADENGYISFFAFKVYGDSLFTYLVSFSVLLQAIFLPIIGSIADIYRLKRKFLYFFASVGSVSTIFLFFLHTQTIEFGSVMFVLANVSFGISVVMYNGLLNEIAIEHERDRVSTNGWAFGYLGGGLLLALNLIFIFFSSSFGLSLDYAIRVSLAMAGVWWGLFSIVSYSLFRAFTEVREIQKFPLQNEIKINPITQLYRTIKSLAKNRNAFIFLVAYILFNDGVQTVIVVSAQFGFRELNIGIEKLLLVILMVQFIAFFGVLGFGNLAEKINAKNSIIVSLVIWCIILIIAYGFLKNFTGFLFLSVLIAIVLGGTQALSRSLFSIYIPKSQEAEYFSFYEISEKGTSWIGPATFGIILEISKSYRLAVLSLILFFLLGLILLFFIKKPTTR